MNRFKNFNMCTNYKINAKEVLLYLNQLGYTNISAHTLKEFLTGETNSNTFVLYFYYLFRCTYLCSKLATFLDLKKLLKSSVKQQIHLSDFFNDYTPIRNVYQTSRCDSTNTKDKNSFQEFNRHTDKQEVPSSNMRQISLHLLRNIGRNPHEHCIHIEDGNSDVIKIAQSDKTVKNKENKSVGESATVESTSRATMSSSKQSSKSTSGRQRGGKSNKHILACIVFYTANHFR